MLMVFSRRFRMRAVEPRSSACHGRAFNRFQPHIIDRRGQRALLHPGVAAQLLKVASTAASAVKPERGGHGAYLLISEMGNLFIFKALTI